MRLFGIISRPRPLPLALFAPRGCHLEGLVPPFYTPWDLLAPREHLGGTILAPRDHPGGPCEQQDGHEVARNRIFIDFKVNLVEHRGLTFYFCFGLVSKSSFIDFRIEISMLGAPNSKLSHGAYCKNLLFTEIVLYGIRDRFLSFWKSIGISVLVLAALRTNLEIEGFLLE